MTSSYHTPQQQVATASADAGPSHLAPLQPIDGTAATNAATQGSHPKTGLLKRKEMGEDQTSMTSVDQPGDTAMDTNGNAAAAKMKQRRKESRYIKAGDLVIIFISRDRPFSPLTVTPGQTFTNAFGSFPHDLIIGRPFGSQMRSANNKGFLTLLRPTPELWTLSLPHRTQILYSPDMSFISMRMGLGPGSRIVEAGTGSGSFTHFLARCVGIPDELHGQSNQTMGREWKGQEGWGVSIARGKGVQTRPPKDKGYDSNEGTPGPAPPFKDTAVSATPVEGGGDDEAAAAIQNSRVEHFKSLASPTPDFDGEVSPSNGKVWTFEFHASRAALSRKEFLDHSLTPLVSTSHRNVCLYGFPSSLDGLADAVFLDLPAPWEAIPFTPSVLNPKTQGIICCFSPCIEQVLRTVKALGEAGFKDVETFESLVRTHESVKSGFAGGVNGGCLFDMPLKPIGEVVEKLHDRVKRREKMSENQRRKAKEKKEGKKKVNGRTADGCHLKGKEATSEEEEEDDGPGEEDTLGEQQQQEQENEVSQERPSGVDIHTDVESERAPSVTTTPSTSAAGADLNSHSISSKATQISTPSNSSKPCISAPKPSIYPLPSHFGQGKEYKQQVVRSNTYSRVLPSMRGHTSYLTFGRLPPRA